MPTRRPPARIVSDRLEPVVARRYLAAVRATKDATAIEAVEAALRSGSLAEVQRIVDQLSRALGPTTQVLAQGYGQSGDLAATTLGAQLSTTISFDVKNPRAAVWASRNAGRLITAVSDETRQAIRTMIRDSVADGIDVRRTAGRIRDVIGLTDRLADAVVNQSRRLVEQGNTEAQVDAATGRYMRKLLTYRSQVIARTEIVAATIQGQRELWTQAVDAGQLDARVTSRVWIVTPDDRLCPLCAPMDGQETELEGQFTFDGEPIDGPPGHPQCRCAEGLVFHRD